MPESIRELARKYDARSDSESLRGLTATPPALGSPAAAAAAAGSAPAGRGAAAEAMEVGEEAGTPVAAGAGAQGSSPALAPTPHSVLNSVMRRNDLFEGSPAQASPAGAAAAVASDNGAAPPSPASALAQLLAPVLLATIDEVGAGKQAQGECRSAGGGAGRWMCRGVVSLRYLLPHSLPYRSPHCRYPRARRRLARPWRALPRLQQPRRVLRLPRGQPPGGP